MDDISRDIERIGLPQRPRKRKPDIGVRHGALKVFALRIVAVLLFGFVLACSLLVVFYYKSGIMTLIALVYLGLGAFLAHKLFSLTYTGWLYTLLLSGAGVLMPVLAVMNKGFQYPAVVAMALAVIAVSLFSAALLWWAKDLFGIKNYREIFLPYT